MARFPVNASRFDPYKNFKFRVKWEGRVVAGLSKVSGFKRTAGLVKHRKGGGDPSAGGKTPGRPKYQALSFERGITHDAEFQNWATMVWDSSAPPSLNDFSKDMLIEVCNEAGQVVLSYKVFRCRVSEMQSLPDLDANANAVAIESLKLENEGWEQV